MKRVANILGLLLLWALPCYAKIPWNSTVTTVAPVAGAATCSLPAVCIFNLTGNLTSLTLSGGTAGSIYSLIFVQDGTGSRTFTVPANLIAGAVNPAPAIPSAANAWTTWIVQFDGTNYDLEAAYDNIPIFDAYINTYQSLGTSISATTLQQQVRNPSTISVIFPGMTVTSTCWCTPQVNPMLSPPNVPANWRTGVFATCQPNTNSATCAIVNPTAGSITPDQDALNIRGLQ